MHVPHGSKRYMMEGVDDSKDAAKFSLTYFTIALSVTSFPKDRTGVSTNDQSINGQKYERKTASLGARNMSQ